MKKKYISREYAYKSLQEIGILIDTELKQHTIVKKELAARIYYIFFYRSNTVKNLRFWIIHSIKERYKADGYICKIEGKKRKAVRVAYFDINLKLNEIKNRIPDLFDADPIGFSKQNILCWFPYLSKYDVKEVENIIKKYGCLAS